MNTLYYVFPPTLFQSSLFLTVAECNVFNIFYENLPNSLMKLIFYPQRFYLCIFFLFVGSTLTNQACYVACCGTRYLVRHIVVVHVHMGKILKPSTRWARDTLLVTFFGSLVWNRHYNREKCTKCLVHVNICCTLFFKLYCLSV